ncbi:immunoglobulin-like domain-containing protein [Tumebacillus permanentifrigoris]|uniref:Atrophied bacterial Ig domain-containing protein n=1 Tax=Tumebacillus permanentifrigoris TaxID=378543 RepID=A0A316DT80_9BACL|nr:immunoglobulin-like domain-containing protein [Tumebacillus permanentifrigoris]PWK10219.1 hypothetical protein C7459_11240 [Tumebacillus permanentifrigoris]
MGKKRHRKGLAQVLSATLAVTTTVGMVPVVSAETTTPSNSPETSATLAPNVEAQSVQAASTPELDAVNAAATAADLRAALENVSLGLDLTLYSGLADSYKTQVASSVLSARPGGGYATAGDVQAALDTAVTKAHAVLNDLAALTIGYAGSDSLTSVTTNVSLPVTGPNGSTVSWSSDQPGILDAMGNVNRPAYLTGDVTVQLTATVTDSPVTSSKTFLVKVIKQAETDAEAVSNAKSNLSLGFAAGDSASGIISNLTLPGTGLDSTTVSWSSSNPAVLAADGTVARPAYLSGNQTVTLTATITKNGATETKQFVVVVTKMPETDAEAVTNAKQLLEITYAGGESATGVTSNLMLATSGADGTTVSWTSSDLAIVAADGTVNRPAFSDGDKPIHLTATITKNGSTDTKVFVIDVLKAPQTAAEAVNNAKTALDIGYQGADSQTAVTQNLTLSTTGADGTAVSWSSSNPGLVASNGAVNRPAFASGDAIVTLTATISKGGSSTTKSFLVQVLKQTATDADTATADANALSLTYSPGDSAATVRNGLILPTTGPNGSTVTWSSDTPATVANNGNVTRPGDSMSDVFVTLTATVTYNAGSATKTFVVKVLHEQDTEAVANAKAALQVGYAGGDNSSSVTANLTLPTSGVDGTTISWASTDLSVNATTGVVIRPPYLAGDQPVTLTATITRGVAIDTQTYNLVVTKLPETDAEAVSVAKAALTVGYGGVDTNASVTQNLTLATTGADGTTVSWSSTDTAYVATDGTVTRPTYVQGPQSITLTATITRGGATDTQTFNLTLPALAQTDAEAVASAKAALAIGYAGADTSASVTSSLTLDTTGTDGTTITWSSNNLAVVAVDGTVTPPAYLTGDQTVTLTATIVKNGASDTKTFTVTVMKSAETDAEAVSVAKAALDVTYGGGDSATGVTQNVTLSPTGADGTTVTWASDMPGVIATDGTVIRPAYLSGDKTVTLTATISKNGTSDTKSFTLTVKTQTETDTEAVSVAKTALAVGYAGSDSSSSVTQNLSLISTGADGTTVTWSSSDLTYLATNGDVTRPAYLVGDQTITLTATITKGGSTDTKTFTVTITALGETDAEAVSVAKAALTVGYGAGDSAANVTQGLTLPTTGSDGTSISWSSSDTMFVANDGTVTNPTYVQGPQVVTLTATITRGGASDTQVYTLTLPANTETDAEAVSLAKAALNVVYTGADSATGVTQALGLPTSGLDGTTVSWSSSNPAVVAADGTVNSPAYLTGDVTVTLTATIDKNGVTDTKTFTVTVTKLAETDAEAVSVAKAAVAVGYSGADTSAAITQNVTLNTSGLDGTTVAWSSSNPAVVAADGTVTRPVYLTGDQTVTLTATISRGGATDTQSFTVTVVKQAETDAEAVASAKAVLAVGYHRGDTAGSVMYDLTLPTTSVDGTMVSWMSSDPVVVMANGTINRPDWSSGNANVVLTATISKNGVTDTQTFAVTVEAITESDALADAQGLLDVNYASGDSAMGVTQSLTLPTTGAHGTTVTWSSSDAALVDAAGLVHRPAYLSGDQLVELTATIDKNGTTVTKTFLMRVVRLAETDGEAVLNAKMALDLGYTAGDTAVGVTQMLTLPSTGLDTTNISWSSDKPAVIDATTGAVTRPAYNAEDEVVVLTATIQRGGNSVTKQFVLKVLKNIETDAQAVASAKAVLEPGFAMNDSATMVTQNITLSAVGVDGTDVAWSSSNPAVVSSMGVVTRPLPGAGDATITLTATITKNGTTDTKTFTVIVLQQQQTALNPSQISVFNHPNGTPDSVQVTNVQAGDVIKVYSAATGGVLLGQTTATGSTAVVTIAELGSAAGTVYVTITSSGLLESNRVAKVYASDIASPYMITNGTLMKVSGGLKATVTVAPTLGALPVGGSKYVLFELMKGITPVSISTVLYNGQSAVDMSMLFSVTGSDYTVKVYIVDSMDGTFTNIGNSLADAVTLTVAPAIQP